jgi:tRNA (guanine-N7-)-methyltransferase
MSDHALTRKLSAQTLPWATDWDALFGRSAPLILEIGFGHGAFLAHLAQLYPDANLIGIEIANRCLDAAEALIERLRLPNVRVIHARAETALHHLFRPATLAEVHINFPDPWFKLDQQHRRLMQRDTLDALVSRMQTGAALYLATDIEAYARMSAKLLAETPGLDNLLPDSWLRDPSAHPHRIITKYERKALRDGRTPYYFAYRRSTTAAPDIPVIEDLPMPHLIFASPLDLEALHAGFTPLKTREGETIIHLMTAYRGRGALLVEAHIAEPTIDQHIALLVLEKWRDQPGTYTIQLSPLGHPRPTAGVHRAVWLLAEGLLALHPDARIIDHKLQT